MSVVSGQLLVVPPAPLLPRSPLKEDLMHKQNQHKGLFLWENWVMATAAGSVVGFGAIAAFNALTSRVENVNIYTILLVVGIVEGVVLGFSQFLALRRYIQKPLGWVIFTTVTALLAWLIGLALSYLMAVTFSFVGDGMKFLALLPAMVLLGGGDRSSAGICPMACSANIRENIHPPSRLVGGS